MKKGRNGGCWLGGCWVEVMSSVVTVAVAEDVDGCSVEELPGKGSWDGRGVGGSRDPAVGGRGEPTGRDGEGVDRWAAVTEGVSRCGIG